MKRRLRPPLWLGIALVLGLASALFAHDRAKLAAAQAELRASDATSGRLRALMPALVGALGPPRADLAADTEADTEANPAARLAQAVPDAPAELRRVVLRSPAGRTWTQRFGPPLPMQAALLERAWAAPGDGRLLDDAAGIVVVWQVLRHTGWNGWRLAAVGSLAEADAAAASAQRGTLLLLGALAAALLLLVVTYLAVQATALRRLAREADQVAADVRTAGAPPAGPLVAREVAALADAMQRARERVAEELARNRELWQVFRSATSTGGEALMIVDDDGRVLLCNERVEGLLLRPVSELTGRPLLELLAPGAREAFAAGLHEFRRVGRHPFEAASGAESAVLRSDDQVLPVQLAMRSVSFEGAPCLCVSLREIGDEKQRQRQLAAAVQHARAAEATKARFLANMSHEIRTPLNGIHGVVDLLGDTPLDAHQRELLDTLRTSTARLRRLLDDILDLSKIEAGHLRLAARRFDVQAELHRVTTGFQPAAAARGLRLAFHFTGTVRAVVGDPFRIGQILQNLLDNALKFTPSGAITVHVDAGTAGCPAGRCRIAVEVHDTGVGIAREVQDGLFAAFTQADETTTRRFGGTGLGLALSRELCQAMAGDIAVHSAPGQGATFRFHVLCEVAPGAADPVPSPALAAPAPPPQLHGRRVLVADDNLVNRKVLEHLLRSAGMQWAVAEDGEQAVAAAAAGDFDLVLMDVSMPKLNGYDATRAIRALPDVARARIPVIGVTALAMPGDAERCRAAGMDAYVAKPVDRAVLLAAIERVLEAQPALSAPTSG
jgi:PAS domain S-box-containing protein